MGALAQRALEELERRTVVRGSRKRLAHLLDMSQASLCMYLTERRPLSDKVAARVLYLLHEEEQRLADKIEAEMRVPWRAQ